MDKVDYTTLSQQNPTKVAVKPNPAQRVVYTRREKKQRAEQRKRQSAMQAQNQQYIPNTIRDVEELDESDSGEEEEEEDEADNEASQLHDKSRI